MKILEVTTKAYGIDNFAETNQYFELTEDANPIPLIAEHIVNDMITSYLETMTPSNTTVTRLKDIPSVPELTTLLSGLSSDAPLTWESDDDKQTLHATIRMENDIVHYNLVVGSCSYDTYYSVNSIPDGKLVIMVIENKFDVTPSRTNATNLLHKPFKNLAEAKAFAEVQKPADNACIETIVTNIEQIDPKWLSIQTEILDILADHPELQTPEYYHPMGTVRLEKLKQALSTN